MRVLLVVLSIAMALSMAADVSAQALRGRPGTGPAAGSGPASRAGNSPYSAPAGRTGTVTASTPNRDGNFGGPGTGGGAGSP